MKLLSTLLGIISAVLLSSCSDSLSVDRAYREFKAREDFPKTYDVYKNAELLKDKSNKTSKIVINKASQRLRLYIGSSVAVDTPCTTGKSGKRTRSGSFKVTSKIRNKRSNIFGRCYHNGRFVCGGDRRKCRKPYNKFIGSSLPYWMRLTDDGIGIHASRGVRRYPASNGCIRVPYSIAPTLYYKTNKYTHVEIK